ncbi:class I adenylate-forming enzyme family protein [Rhodococcus qingshengii]|uniref:class I adenylate-forming enzyme family protein n=1 Tax=Rhodococcus qingshengii TaxID=334542 RepID=UPI0010A63C7E|nr:class I adenylate-forming enzyme family protein [Rhodococcus qingshengii]THJ67616.1 acyl--CoA ligase [Rhodococcus qingshengii]
MTVKTSTTWLGAPTALRCLTAPDGTFPLTEDVAGDRRFLNYRDSAQSMREYGQRLGAFGDRRALVLGETVRTYGDLQRDVIAVAHWLRSVGVEHGDRISILSRNRTEFPAVFWATLSVGAIFVPFNPWWTTSEIEYAIADATPSVIFAELGLLDGISLPADEPRIVGMGFDEIADGLVGWDEIVNFGPCDELPAVEVGPDDLATIIYTSGTTGRPKGVLHTHRNHCAAVMNAAVAGALANSSRIDKAAGPAPDAVVLQILPWFHVAGLGSMYAALIGGAVNIIQPRWNADQALAAVLSEKITTVGGVPTMLAELLDKARQTDADLSSLRNLTSGATAVPESLLREIRDVLGTSTTTTTGYGLTETTSSVALHVGSDMHSRPGSVGVEFPVNEIRILDQQMREVPIGESGEIWIKGPTVGVGYWRNTTATREAFVAGAFRTGDLGRKDAEGFIYLVGRIKDIIIRGGENIQAAEIEKVIAEIPGVANVAVVGMPDERLGEEVVAVLDLQPGSTLTDADIEAYCRKTLASIKVPSLFIRTVSIPRSATGKILKNNLKRSLAESADAAGAINPDQRTV